MEHPDLADQIARLRQLMTGSDPLPQNFLVGMSEDQWLAKGSVTPAFGLQFTERPTGLLVPSSAVRDAQPIDQFKVYLLADEVLGRSIPLEGVIEALRRTPLELAIRWCAGWMSRLRAPAATHNQVDLLFAREHLKEPARTRVINVLRDRRRVLLTPQGLLCLTKLALLFCGQRGLPENADDGRMAFALIGLMEHLGADLEGLRDDDELVISGVPGPLGREVIANQLANSSRQEAGRWATFQRCWRELPDELVGHPRVLSLQEEYEAVSGVPLDDLVTICATLWASTANARPHILPDYLGNLNWAPERMSAVLDLVAASPSQMAQMVRDEATSNGVAWSIRTFEQYPVMRWENGDLTVIDADLLVDRASGIWPLYDILRELEAQGRKGQASRVKGCYDHVIETHTLEIVRGITGGESAGRVYDEEALRAAYGHRGKVSDAAIDYGHAWVVMDATTTGLHSLTVAGVSDEGPLKDIDGMVRKAAQLDATVNNIRSNEDALTGVNFTGLRRFYPVIVAATRTASGPIFMSLLHERLAKEGFLQGPDVAPLELMELEDLDIVEGLSESEGPGLLTVLAAKEYSPMRDMSVRDYIIRALGRRDVGRPERVDKRWKAWLDTAIDALSRVA